MIPKTAVVGRPAQALHGSQVRVATPRPGRATLGILVNGKLSRWASFGDPAEVRLLANTLQSAATLMEIEQARPMAEQILDDALGTDDR